MAFERPSSLAAIDLRSVAAFRMALGAIVVWDQGHALSDAGMFFSDAGVMPRSLLLTTFQQHSSHWSMHMLGGSTLIQSILILIAIASGFAVALGWRTRWSLLVAWALTISLQSRNPVILYGGDNVLRMMEFWGLFLPLGACWSLDAKHSAVHSEPNPHLSVASLAILLQVAMIYWFTAILKWGNEWTRDGTAVYYVLMADQFVKTPGLWLLPHADLCRWLSFGVWWVEMIGPFFAFIPWRNAAWRIMVIAGMWSLHLGLALCLRIGFFPAMMAALWLLFIPGLVWDYLARKWPYFAAPIGTGARTDSSWQQTLAHIFALVCLAVITVWNLWTVNPERWKPWLPEPVVSAVNALRIDQNWALFAPTPVTDDGWMILDAELYDGSHIDLLRNGRPLVFDKPARISAEFPNWRWHKFEVNLLTEHNAPLRITFGDYLAREWSQSHPRVRRWTLWFMRETTLPQYTVAPPQKVELARNAMFVTP